MSTPGTEPPETTPAPEEGGEQQKDPAWYRDQLERKEQQIKDQQKEINKQRVKLLEKTFEDVGLDPTKGIGKAVAEKYDGEADAQAIREFAVSEYQWEPPEPENPTADAINQAQGRVSGAVNDAQSTQQTPIDIEIAEAEESGNFARSMQLKVQKFRQQQGI